MEKRIVVLLGAGASQPLGYPVTDSILPEIWGGLQDARWKRWPGLKKLPPREKRRRASEPRRLLAILLPGLSPGRDLSTAVEQGMYVIDLRKAHEWILIGCSLPSEDIMRYRLFFPPPSRARRGPRC